MLESQTDGSGLERKKSCPQDPSVQPNDPSVIISCQGCVAKGHLGALKGALCALLTGGLPRSQACVATQASCTNLLVVDNEKAQLCSGTEVGGAVLFTCALPLRALVPFNAAF